jgi:hypothetical protein
MSNKPSTRFTGLSELKKQRGTTEQPTAAAEVMDERELRETEMATQPAQKQPASTGRAGKKGNPDYQQATAYIPRKLHEEVQVKLIKNGKRQDFSQLVETLLKDWIQRD